MKTYRIGLGLIFVSLLLAGCNTLPPDSNFETTRGRIAGPDGAFVEYWAKSLDDHTYDIVAYGPGKLTEQQVLDGWIRVADKLAAGRPYEKQTTIESHASQEGGPLVGEEARRAAGTKVRGRIVLNVAGGATARISRVPMKAEARFTIAHLERSQVDVPPNPTRVVEPESPSGIVVMDGELLAPHWPDGGYANVQTIVDRWGIPREVQCVEASNAALARDAETLVKLLRYSPAKKAGKAVAMKWDQRIRFTISSDLGSGEVGP